MFWRDRGGGKEHWRENDGWSKRTHFLKPANISWRSDIANPVPLHAHVRNKRLHSTNVNFFNYQISAPVRIRSSTQEHAGTRKPSYSVGYRNLSIIKAKPQNRCQSRLKNKAHNPKLARWWGCNYSAGGLFWIPSQTWGGLSFRTDGLSIFHVFKQTWTINMFFFC